MRAFALQQKATQRIKPAESTTPSRAHFARSPELNSRLFQRTIGSHAVQRIFEQPKLDNREGFSGSEEVSRFGHDFSRIPIYGKISKNSQAQITISRPTDTDEQEADRVSEQVMRMPDAELRVSPAISRLQREPVDLDIEPQIFDEEEPPRVETELGHGPPVDRQPAESSARNAPSPLPRELGVSSPGEPLPTAVRAEFEARFGRDLSMVRFHSGPDATRSALFLNARAYTTGSHVVFGTNQYSPGSHAGRLLLAHELTHVVQQAATPGSRGRAGSGPVIQRDKLPTLATIPQTSVSDRIAELKARAISALGGGDIPVLELLQQLQRAVAAPKTKSAEIAKDVDSFLKSVDAHPLEPATESLIGNVGDDIAAKLVAKGLTDEADRILAHFHSATSNYESKRIFGTTTSYIAIGSGFFPDASRREGGFTDRRGNPLHTLHDFEAGTAPFVSVAMDADNGPPFGTRLSIDEFPGVVFRVVDTGDAFKGKGLTRIDICTANKKASQDPKINGPLHLRFAIPLPYHEPRPVTY
jgi:hypothetical protein